MSIILTFEGLVIPWQEDSMLRVSTSTADFLKDTAPWLNESERQALCTHLVLDNPDLSYVLIVDRDGKAIAHSDPQRVGMVFDDPGTLAAARQGKAIQQTYTRDQDNTSSPYYGERIIDILYPMSDQDGNPAGAVDIGLSMTRVDTMKGQYRMLVAIISFVILISMLLSTYNFFSHVYRPINTLVRATRKFRDGQTPAGVSNGGGNDDEITELAGEFNGMSGRLSVLIADLSRREQDLQEYVDHLLTFNAKLSPEGVIEIMNRATPRPAGMRRGNLVGFRLHEEACWDMSSEARARLSGYLERAAQGEAVQYEETLGLEGSRVILDIGLRPVKGSDKAVAYIVAEVRDITRRRLAEDALRESEMKFRVLADTSPVSICLYQGEHFVYVNDAFVQMTGYGKDELQSMKFWAWGDPDAQDMLRDRGLAMQRREPVPPRYEAKVRTKEGGTRWAMINAGPIDYNGRPACIATFVDITDRQRAEELLRQSEEKYRAIFENTVTGTVILEEDMTISLTNSVFEKLTGYTREEIEGRMKLEEFLPPEIRDQALENHRLHFLGEDMTTRTFEYQVIDRQGMRREVIAKGSMLPGTRQAVISLLDITERKQAEDLVKTSLKEKDVLLREIHHRVKNNLQIISSLLNLQSNAIGNDATTMAYQESQNRIRSMALIHEKLYQSKDLSRIDFSDYIYSLTRYLFQSYVKDQSRVQLDLHVEKVSLNIDAAIPCGLIINELVTNSLKHAFPENRRGRVTVSLHVRQDRIIELTVQDDGVGLREGLDTYKAKTLGLQLVNALAAQLGGKVEVITETGVAFKITFRDRSA